MPAKLAFPTPWQRIVRAAELDAGIVLSADEVARMAADQATVTRAELDDHDEQRAKAAYEERFAAER